MQESAAYVREHLDSNLDDAIYVTLGSGFKKILEDIEPEKSLSLDTVPHVKTPKVAGHGRELVLTTIAGHKVLIQTGRTHFYEGHSVGDCVYTTRLAAQLGIKKFICTNASGSLNREITPGTLVVISDHINMTGMNALIGESGSLGERFIDMLNCYDKTWINQISQELKLTVGTYVGLTGPTYETAAETRMLGILGGDIVGMSTVQEVIAARQLGVKVMGVSLATNFAAGISSEVNHQEVLETGMKAAPLVKKIFPKLIEIAAQY